MTDRTLTNLRNRLEKAELAHLRAFILQQENTLEQLRDQLQSADDNAEYWRESWFNLSEQVAEETGGVIGMTQEGEIGLVGQPAPEPSYFVNSTWPGTNAIYAGISISKDGTRPVHLILWPEDDTEKQEYEDAVILSEAVNPAMNSHLPTRIQYLTLLENLKSHFDTDWYWTLTKTDSGKAAFTQYFLSGTQILSYLSAELRVRAVSEIPL